jgi:hypothetical protein
MLCGTGRMLEDMWDGTGWEGRIRGFLLIVDFNQ